MFRYGINRALARPVAVLCALPIREIRLARVFEGAGRVEPFGYSKDAEDLALCAPKSRTALNLPGNPLQIDASRLGAGLCRHREQDRSGDCLAAAPRRLSPRLR